MPDQEIYGKFTPAAWNIIKSIKLTEEEQDKLRFMIDTKVETISKDELQSMLYDVVHSS